MSELRITIEASPTTVEATLWINGCPVAGHADSTGTISTTALVAPLLRLFEREREARTHD